MNNNLFYNSYIIGLFIFNFNELQNKYKNENYDWINFENIFNNIFKILSDENINEDNFIKYYYIFTFLYLNYSNYLVYINHKDCSNAKLEKIVKKIKTNNNIVKNIFKLSSNKHIQKIIKTNNIYIYNKIKKNINVNNLINYYIQDIKQFDKISELENDNYKKILNLIIYRFISCKNNNYSNYHSFFMKNLFLYNSNNNLLDFDYFIKQIPKSRKILNILVNTKNNDKINVNINKILNFILEKNNKFFIDSTNEKFIIIKNKNCNGSIKINISNNFENIEFNQYQTNYNFLHYNLIQLKEFNFLNKSFSSIEINIFSLFIKDLSSVLEFIHLITISIKIISSYPSDIYECLYPIEYTNYYFDTFCTFIEFFKNDINSNYLYNKFIIDVIKFLYIYSYFDYYFYFSNNLIDTLFNNIEHKNNIFLEFVNNLKNILKLPKELLPFPPFFKNDFDINSVIYYNFEIPSYFKLFDILNAICYVFDKKKYSKNNKQNIIDIIINHIHFDNTHNYIISTNKCVSINNFKSDNDISYDLDLDSDSESELESESESESSDKLLSSVIYSKDFESKLDTDIINEMTMNDRINMEKSNTYIELNINPDISDCILYTEN